MDAIKILGSLLSNNALGSNTGGGIIDSLLGGGSQSRSGGAGDILGTLIGGQKRGGSGGLGALGAILAAASRRGGSGSGLDALGSLLSGASGGASGRGGGGGADLLGSLLGGGAAGQRSGGGGLGGMIGNLLGGGRGRGARPAAGGGGGAGALLGSLMGGSGGGGNPLNDLLGSRASSGNGSEMLGALLGGGEPEEPPREAQEEAELLIQAMCYAAKADGKIDEAEKEAILGRLGELDDDEIAYLREHLEGSVDLDSFTSKVPDDMDEQVYAFSLMAIRLDTQSEAEYFGKLANGLGMNGEDCNRIHRQLDQPEIFA